MARSIEACIARVAARGRIGQKEAQQLIEDLAERAENMRRTGADDPVVTAAWDMARKMKEGAKADRIDALRNATIRNNILTRIDREGGIAKADQTIRSVLHSVPGANVADSIEGRWHGLSRSWRASLGFELSKNGVLEAAISGHLDNEVAEALWRAHGGAPDSTVTVSTPAQKIADAIAPRLDLARDRQNAEGARIGDAVDYVTRSTWDSRQLRRAAGPGAAREDAFQAWWRRERPRMADKTFDDVTPMEGETIADAEERMGRSIYDATESGIHMRNVFSGAAADDIGPAFNRAFEGSSNLARRASQQRVVFWKDAASWLAHQREFGGGDSIYAQVDRTLDQGARRTALMHGLGTNPAGNLEMILRKVQERYRTEDGLEAFNKRIQGIRNVMGRLDGTLNIPVNVDHAQRAENLLMWEAMAHLGGVSITHIAAAPATVTAELAQHGVSHLEGLGRVLKALLTGRGSLEKQEILNDAGAYAHGYALQIASKWQPGDGLPGFMSWAAAHFMRLTPLEHFLSRFQTDGVKSVLMTRLGRMAEQSFDRLDPLQARILNRYGIGTDEWDLLRRTSEPLHVEGQRYITPRDALHTDPEAVKALLEARGLPSSPKEVERFQWDLGDRYLMYLNDAAEHSTVTPGVRERALAYGESRPGSWGYTLRRFTAQFKMWPIAAWNQIITREIGYNLASKARIAKNLGWLLAFSTAGGALRMSINDALVGNPQRNYMNPVTLLAALAQGGGLGIFGDFLFGETSRMGAGLVSTAAGPVFSLADRVVQVAQRFKADLKDQPDKAVQHLWPDLVHVVVSQIPFANLFYLKGALDYLLWYHLYEAASPGWWERTNRRLIKERGRPMQGYRPGGPIPWNPLPGIAA